MAFDFLYFEQLLFRKGDINLVGPKFAPYIEWKIL